MNLTDRQIKIINMLMIEENPRPVRYYANKLNVSERTIYSDLEQLELVAEKLGFHIERKRGVGVRANSLGENQKVNLVDELPTTVMYDVKERRSKIFELLLFSGKTLTYQYLADYFFVSKTSIHSDLRFIKEHFINDSTAELMSDSYGTRLEGTEEQFQNTFVRFNEHFKNEVKLDVLNNETQQEYSFLKRYYGAELVKHCQNVVYDFVKDNLEVIAEYYIDSILNRLIILVYRSVRGFHIEVNEIEGKKTELNPLLHELSSTIEVSFSIGDVVYLNKHMEANKMIGRQEEDNYLPIIENALSKLSETIKVDFTKDYQLINQLTNHFPSMIYRLKNNITIENPFLSQIKHEFGLMYNITWFVMSSLEDKLNVSFTDKEIGFLVIYFQSTLDRMQMSKRVLIVCPTGITTSGLLYNRAKRILPPLDMVQVASFDSLEEINLDEIDFIISTAYIKVKDIPVVVVSPLLSDEDMQKVSTFYNSIFILKERNENEIIKNSFSKIKKYIDFRFVEFGCNYDTAESLIDDVTNRLVTENYVGEGYKSSLLEREKVGGTDLPTGVVVPHGRPQYVFKTVVAVYVNKHSIKWNEENIRVAIFLCISNDDMQYAKEIIGEVYNLIEDKEIVDRVFINSNKVEFLNILGGNTVD